MKFFVFCAALFFVDVGLGCNSQLRLRSSNEVPSFEYHPHRSMKRLPFSPTRRGPLIWEDEFNYLDYNKWTPMITGWRGSNSFQIYVNRSENLYVRDGNLFIKPTLTADRFSPEFLYNGTLDLTLEGCNVNWGGGCIVILYFIYLRTREAGDDIIPPIQSARIHTKTSFSFTYGIVEVRAKMPKGDWIWPAVWMSPTDSVYGSNPRSGEIDITEVRTNRNLSCNGKPHGRQLSGTTLHWGPDAQHNGHRMTYWQKVLRNPDFSSDFHLFGVEWLPTGFTFFVDNELIGYMSPPPGGFWEMGGFEGENIWNLTGNGTKIAPFDHPFHFILDVAVGGNMFPDWCINQPFDEPLEKPWKMSDPVQMRPFWEERTNWLPTWNIETEDNAMRIDYIRVYALHQDQNFYG